MTQIPFQPSEEELSRELGQALERIYANTPDMEFDDLVKAYRKVQDYFLPQVGGNEFFTLETKRRVAELMLYSALEKQSPFELCRKLFDELSQLGFTNLERKSTVYLIYSRYCLQAGREDEGINLLELLEVELKENLHQAELPIYLKLLQTTLEVLEHLRLKRQQVSE
jgi:hypothetical protein